MDDDRLCSVYDENWLGCEINDDLHIDPEKFVPCQFEEFHPAALYTKPTECQIRLFAVDESKWQAYYHEDIELVNTVPGNIRHQVLDKLSGMKTPAEEALHRLQSEVAYLQNSLDSASLGFGLFPSRQVTFPSSLLDPSDTRDPGETDVFVTRQLPTVPENEELVGEETSDDSEDDDRGTLRTLIPGAAADKRAKRQRRSL